MKAIILSVLLSFPFAALSATVNPETKITVIRPLKFDDARCEKQVFSDKIATLGNEAIPIIGSTSQFDYTALNPASNRAALLVSLNQGGIAQQVLRIEGLKNTVENIQRKLATGKDTKLTEYLKCAESDETLDLVQLVHFSPSPYNAQISLKSSIALVRKNEEGECKVGFNKTIAELISAFNRDLDLSDIKPIVSIFAHSVTREGELSGKRILIHFKNKNGFLLSRPVLSINLPAPLAYSALDSFSLEESTLTMTGIKDCRGERLDDPIWISDFAIQ